MSCKPWNWNFTKNSFIDEIIKKIESNNKEKAIALINSSTKEELDKHTSDDFKYFNLLWYASHEGYFDIVKLLVDKGCYIDSGDSNCNDTPLLIAKTDEIAEYLIDHGANLEHFCTYNSDTPLLLAIDLKQESRVKLLLEKGANVHTCTRSHCNGPISVIDLAIMGKNIAIIDMIKEYSYK